MKKIYQLFGNPEPKKGDVGIEIECEGDGLAIVESDTWKTEDDGSLRGEFPTSRAEFILRKPIPIESCREALTELFSNNLKDATFKFSHRTSVHVHVNVHELTADQVVSMVYAYLILEEVVMSYCKEHRKGNKFALRMSDADGMVEYLRRLVRSGVESGLRNQKPNNAIRYSAINIESLWKYGSIEFRGLEGTNDIERIATWAEILLCFREFAKKTENILDVFDLFIKEGVQSFVNKVLGDKASLFIFTEDVVDRNFSLSIEIPFAFNKKPPKLGRESDGDKVEDLLVQYGGINAVIHVAGGQENEVVRDLVEREFVDIHNMHPIGAVNAI